MRRVLMIGTGRLGHFRDGLHGEGYEAVLQTPGSVTELGELAPDAIVVEVSSGAEDAWAKRVMEGSPSADRPPVIALVEPAALASFDPTLGWDDFIVVTAPAEELSLRLRQALWKRVGVDTSKALRCGDLEIDLANYTVHLAGRPVALTYKEYELLRFLAASPGRVFNREMLLNKVWGYDFYGGGRTVDVHIRRLRSKIEDRHHTFIETVRNVGYRFRASP